MKKFFIMMVALMLSLSLCACGKTTEGEPAQTTTQTVTVTQTPTSKSTVATTKAEFVMSKDTYALIDYNSEYELVRDLAEVTSDNYDAKVKKNLYVKNTVYNNIGVKAEYYEDNEYLQLTVTDKAVTAESFGSDVKAGLFTNDGNGYVQLSVVSVFSDKASYYTITSQVAEVTEENFDELHEQGLYYESERYDKITDQAFDQDITYYQDSTLDLYHFGAQYHAGTDSLIFIDVDEYLKKMDGYLIYENYEFDKTEHSYKVFIPYLDEDTNEEKEAAFVLDLDNETVELNLLFGNNTPPMEATDYSFSLYTDEEKSYSNEKYIAKYDLSNYGVDFFIYTDDEGEAHYMAPYWVINLFLNSYNYTNVYFTGDEWVFAYYVIDESESWYSDVRRSSLNGKKQTANQRTDVMNQLAFVFENVFGVKEDEGFSKLSEAMASTTSRGLKSTDASKNLISYVSLLYKDIIDFHTYTLFPSFYNNPTDDFTVSYGTVSKEYADFSTLHSTLSNDRASKQDGVSDYVRFYDDTAIITLDSFATAPSNEVFDADGVTILKGAEKKDSFALMRYCLEKIQAKSNIKNVVVDVTLNGGGNVGAMLRVLGFFIQDNYNEDYYKGFDLKTSSCYNVDTNRDGVCDASDVYSQYNWYCLASGYSYSAANSFAISCKSAGIKVIGQHTGGGMCSVLPVVLQDGTSFGTSSYSCTTYFTDRVEGGYTFIDVQNGIDPDIVIPISANYDDQALVGYIHADQGE